MFEGPTRVTELSSSQIDYIVSDRTVNLLEVTIEVNALSDHNILLVTFGVDHSAKVNFKIEKRKMARPAIESFC